MALMWNKLASSYRCCVIHTLWWGMMGRLRGRGSGDKIKILSVKNLTKCCIDWCWNRSDKTRSRPHKMSNGHWPRWWKFGSGKIGQNEPVIASSLALTLFPSIKTNIYCDQAVTGRACWLGRVVVKNPGKWWSPMSSLNISCIVIVIIITKTRTSGDVSMLSHMLRWVVTWVALIMLLLFRATGVTLGSKTTSTWLRKKLLFYQPITW